MAKVDRTKPIALLAALGLALAMPASAELTWPGCSALQPSDFRMVRLVGKSAVNSPVTVDASLNEPIKLALDPAADGGVDVYWVERKGAVKRYSTVTRAVSLLGKLNPAFDNEDGLVGIALDPAFKTNRWLYLYYSSGPEFRVSRFTLGAAALDMASEAVVLRIPSDRAKDHSGGAMAFDAYGDLWISVGDNSAGERGTGNSNDMRGSILRILKITTRAGEMLQTLSFP